MLGGLGMDTHIFRFGADKAYFRSKSIAVYDLNGDLAEVTYVDI